VVDLQRAEIHAAVQTLLFSGALPAWIACLWDSDSYHCYFEKNICVGCQHASSVEVHMPCCEDSHRMLSLLSVTPALLSRGRVSTDNSGGFVSVRCKNLDFLLDMSL
jgi:hypothetical protein